MKTKISLFSLFMLFMLFQATAQKKPLTHDVYDDWKSLQSTTISNDGNWTAYRISPQVGDGILEIKSLTNNKTYTIDRVGRYSFSKNSDFVVATVNPEYEKEHALKLKKTTSAKMPKDSLFIINLKSGDIKKVARVKNYQLSNESTEWIAWMHEAPLEEKAKKEEGEKAEEAKEDKKPKSKSKGSEVVLYNMVSGNESRFEGVMEYELTQKGNYLYFEKDEADSLNPAGVFAFNTKSSKEVTLNSGLKDYKKLTATEDGEQLVFFATNSDKKDDDQYFSLMHWKAGSNEAKIIADTTTAGVPNNWMVSDNSNPRFSESGKRLYFGTAPRPVKYAYEEDTTMLDSERPAVDIWSYNDPYIQPMQKLRANRDKNQTYDVVMDLKSMKLVQLGNQNLESIYIDTENDRDFVLAMDDQTYRVQYTWDTQLPRDYYKVDVNTGKAKLLMQAGKGFMSLSPEGNYLTWYDPEMEDWFVMDVATETIRNLTEGISVSFANELHDSPSLAGSYGTAGWSEKDAAFFIYDRFDIWKVDPKGKVASENITNGFGRKSNISFRYQSLDRDDKFISMKAPVLLSATHEWTMQDGFYTANLSKASNPTKVVMEDVSFGRLIKAEDTDRVIFTKSTYEDFGELYVANSYKMDGLKKLTDVGAQEDPYNWGTAELIQFNSLEDGEEMQAILYKPENFDPNKKYPMIVYFYERRTNSLHSHPSPAPSASTINIPYYVSNDYLVLVPDIKYELGYPGPSAYNHVVPATNAVVNMGFVDKTKMAIQGQSWGGYQVAYLVTKTDMFAAGGAGAPVVNMTSAYGGVRWGSGMSRMFQYEKTQSRLGGTLWETPTRYIDNSPLFRMDEVQTPLFIMHNDEDGSVPWYQGIEYYMALRRLGKPSWLVVYNGEDHNLVQRKNRKDLSIRMGQFFDHYLKGAPMPEWMANGLPATLKGRTLGYELVDETNSTVEGEGASLMKEKVKGNK
tara:strand:+ start:98291 stop:101185 length:2895 start_codon:yes stop_codon:yes gene_type:complete